MGVLGPCLGLNGANGARFRGPGGKGGERGNNPGNAGDQWGMGYEWDMNENHVITFPWNGYDMLYLGVFMGYPWGYHASGLLGCWDAGGPG